MAAERGARALLVLVALALLWTGTEAQGRKGRGKGPKNRAVPAKARGAPSALPPLLPGFPPLDELPQGKSGEKRGAKGASPNPEPPAKPAPLPPPDPMKEADEVTAAADHRRRQEEAEEALLREHFRVCDLDENGWISLREGEVTLALDRDEYRRADANQDGRLEPAEFFSQRTLLLARLGARPASVPEAPSDATPATGTTETPATTETVVLETPIAPADAAPVPEEPAPVRPAVLLKRFDGDQSQGLSLPEIEGLFREAALPFSPELVLEKMDANGSGQLEAAELTALAGLVSRHRSGHHKPSPEQSGAATPASPAEPEAASAAATPARGQTHFARLDASGDGFVDEADLRALQSPARLDLRLRAVLSAMDQDGDGRLSEAEFRAALGERR
jgi:hypothetical protein